MIAAAKGLGGPQAPEVARMLGEARTKLAADRAWLTGKREGLANARKGLDTGLRRPRRDPVIVIVR